MKKFTFLLLGIIVSGGYICAAGAEDGCYKTKNGVQVCNYRLPGGGPEQEKCKEKADIADYAWEWKIKDGSKKGQGFCIYYGEEGLETIKSYRYGECEAGATGVFKYKTKGTSCLPSNAASGYCIENGDLNLYDDPKIHANPKDGTSIKIMSCAATECNDNYLLWTTNKKNRHELVVVGRESEGKITGSQGVCHSKIELQKQCDTGCGCAPDEKCVLNEIKVKNHGKEVPAYIGEEMCICKSKSEEIKEDDTPGPTSDCFWVADLEIECDCGVEIKEQQKFPVSKAFLSELQIENCKELQDSFNKVLKSENKNAELSGLTPAPAGELSLNAIELRKKICEEACKGTTKQQSTQFYRTQNNRNVYSGPTKAEIESAKGALDAAFSGEGSVWKDKEGKFNKVRLASDLTAGVVLGTVGGVVSGVVTKKVNSTRYVLHPI